jgi:tetratricopeptide (TPR) repeat protein
LDSLAHVNYAQGKYTEAEELYARAISILEQKLGKHHPDVASIFNRLANVHQAQGRYEEAEKLYSRALTVVEPKLGRSRVDTAMVLNGLGALFFKQGKYASGGGILSSRLGDQRKRAWFQASRSRGTAT